MRRVSVMQPQDQALWLEKPAACSQPPHWVDPTLAQPKPTMLPTAFLSGVPWIYWCRSHTLCVVQSFFLLLPGPSPPVTAPNSPSAISFPWKLARPERVGRAGPSGSSAGEFASLPCLVWQNDKRSQSRCYKQMSFNAS